MFLLLLLLLLLMVMIYAGPLLKAFITLSMVLVRAAGVLCGCAARGPDQLQHQGVQLTALHLG